MHELSADTRMRSDPQLLRVGRHGSSGITWTADSKNLVLCQAEPTIVGTLDGTLVQFAPKAGAPLTQIDGGHCSTITTAPDGSLVYGLSSVARSKLLQVQMDSPTKWNELWPSSRYDTLPRISPDGSRIAFYSTRSGKGGIWVGTSAEGALQQMAEGTVAHSGPAWSKDSERIAFAAGHGLIIGSVRDGRTQHLDLGTVAQHPVWAPDAKSVYYESQSQLWAVKSDGTGRQAIGQLPSMLETQVDLEGKYLYFSGPGRPFALYRIALTGGREELLRDGLTLPSFAITGKTVYYIADETVLYRQTLLDNARDKVFAVPFPGGTTMAWDTKFTISPDERSLIWVQPMAKEIDLVQRKLSR